MRKPYVILIGSASGIGKSTIAAELAKTLNIKHLIESDFLRAVVRGIIGKEYAPALHSSSYDAYKSIRNRSRYTNYDDLVMHTKASETGAGTQTMTIWSRQALTTMHHT